MLLYLQNNLKSYFTPATTCFDQLMGLVGVRFRYQKGRLTQRVQLGDKHYFIKQHYGVGWKEIFKNLFQLRLPICSAKNEWHAITQLKSLGVLVPNVVAFGKRGYNPAKYQSFILMEELTPTISLETLCQQWAQSPPSFRLKNRLITEIARIARTLHHHGMSHRDFYLCHFLLETTHGIDPDHIKLYLIDLHRTQIYTAMPARWIIKDLAGLFFSSINMGFTQRDIYRFMRAYRQQSLRELLRSERKFWEKVNQRGEKLYHEHS